jgi:hypothetical protein
MVVLKSGDIGFESVDGLRQLPFSRFGLPLKFLNLFVLVAESLFQRLDLAAFLFFEKVEFHPEALDQMILFVAGLVELGLEILDGFLEGLVFLDGDFEAAGNLTVFTLVILHGGEFLDFLAKLSVAFDLLLKALLIGTMEKG